MLVLLNSDILFDLQLVTDKVSARLTSLLDACRDGGHRVAIPQTALLEFDRQQTKLVADARRSLESAYATLDRSNVAYTRIAPEEAIQPCDLLRLISGLGVDADVERPTLEDFEDAHWRACLHEEPHPPDTKSDEMRDLIIWAVSLRLSKEADGALLVSRDVVHTHQRGDAEALTARLMRAETIEDALECLHVQTPAGGTIQALLAPAWAGLRDQGLPLVAEPMLRAVARPVFIEGTMGLESVECQLQAPTTTGAVLTARVHVQIRDNGFEEVHFRDIKVGAETRPDLTVEVAAPVEHDDEASYRERLAALQELLGDTQ